MTLPTIPSKVDELLLKAFSTVCEKLYAEDLVPTCFPADGMAGEGVAEDHGARVRNLFSSALTPYGTCSGGLTNFATLPDPYVPPFVALVVQPKQPLDESRVGRLKPHPPPTLCNGF